MSIGNNIRNIRKKNGMTLKQIADIIGCSPQLISQYESGKRQPKLETKKKIADALNCEVSDIDKSIYVISTEYELTPERIERFKKNAEVFEIIQGKSPNEDFTGEERQKILEYKKHIQENKDDICEKRLLMQEKLEQLKTLNASSGSNHLNAGKISDNTTETYIDPLAYENSHSFASSEEELDKLLEQRKEQGEKTLLADYKKLNEIGQLEARKRVSELTEIPRYTKSDKPPQE